MGEGSTIRYTEFEKRVMRGSKNLYRGRLSDLRESSQDLSTKWYELSPPFIGCLMVFSLLSLSSCLWNPTASDVMFLSAWLFFSIHYLLGVMITQFKVKRRSILFLALLALSLSFILLLGGVYHMISRFGLLSQAIYTMVLMMLTLPFYAGMVYNLIKEYRNNRQKIQSEQAQV
ncbi:MAG: hypothetical protein FGF51_07860 [Candidatus Brockarchaeota archaeon]|nr:hypothetical protein [Candidatus Brockarchaeota archaeon]